MIEETLESLTEKVKELAVEIAVRYPDIATVSSHEQLYAIRGSYMGQSGANQDLHRLLRLMRERYNISVEEMIKLDTEANKTHRGW